MGRGLPLRRVLVVDDDLVVLRALVHRLNAQGFQVDGASGALRAQELSALTDYDVVLTDLLMPGMDGIQLLTGLACTAPNASFIMMTGASSLDAYDSRHIDARITSVLKKPIDDVELLQAIEQACEVSRRWRSQLERPTDVVRVLLVEDSATDAMLLQAGLTSLGGYDVTHVPRLAEAISLLHEQSFDTVVTDLTLPDARGLGAVLRLRVASPEATLLVCSGAEDEGLAMQVIEAGAQDFIVKGVYDPAVLGRALRFARVRRRAERRLALMAHTDPLTGLSNRAAFSERLEQALAQAQRMSSVLGVIYLDLDGFKPINDTYGHDMGDVLLQSVAERLRGAVRSYDTVARLGGDEFAVLVTNLAPEGLENAALRIFEALSPPVELPSVTVNIGASLGLAKFPEHATDAAQLVRRADEAMYLAKRARRSQSSLPADPLTTSVVPFSLPPPASAREAGNQG